MKRAAAALGVNISTASRRLERLEDALDAPLFDRTPDGTLPTTAAARLLPFAEGMEEAALGFASGLSDFEVEPAGVVHITAPPGVIDHFFAAAIPALLDRHPKLRLEVSSRIDYLDLTRRQADVALRSHRPPGGDLVSKRLIASDMCVLGHPEVVVAIGRLKKPERHGWVTWGDDLSHLPDAVWDREHVPDEAVLLRTSSMTGQMAAVRRKVGLMTAPRPYTELDDLAELPLSRPLRRSLDALPTSELWLVSHRAHRQVPRIAAVWAWLEEMVGGRSQKGPQ